MNWERLLVVGDGAVARALSASMPRGVLHWHRRQGGPIPACDAAIIAVSDRAVVEVAERVRDAVAPPVMLHCAGGHPSRAFIGHTAPAVGVLHPLRALRGPVASWHGTVFAIEGDEAAMQIARTIVEQLDGDPLPLAADDLPRYHAAAVLAGNHALALLDAGAELLTSLGLPRRRAESALAQLLASAADNVARLPVGVALTGPISRGDVTTVQMHRAALATAEAPRDLYLATARRLIDVAVAAGRVDAATADALRDALYGGQPID